MSHFRAFVANQVLLRIRAFLGLFCPDIEDFTQILCRYLPKKLAAKTSAAEKKYRTLTEESNKKVGELRKAFEAANRFVRIFQL